MALTLGEVEMIPMTPGHDFRLREIISVSLVLSLASCGVGAGLDNAAGAVDRLRTSLEKQSGDWRAYADSAADALRKVGLPEAAQQARLVAASAAGSFGEQSRCSIDMAIGRSTRTLDSVSKQLRRRLWPWQKRSIRFPELLPGICEVSPHTIDLATPPEQRRVLEISGYDLGRSDASKLRLATINAVGQATDVTASLFRSSFYHATADLSSGSGVEVTPAMRELRFYAGRDSAWVAVQAPPRVDTMYQDTQYAT